MEIKEYIREHIVDNVDKLLLSANKAQHDFIKTAVEQITARQHIRFKLPSWYMNDDLWFPSTLSTEQASSELTAAYKAELVIGDVICDMTGGLGIDSSFFAKKAKKVVYIERYEEYAKCASLNFQALHLNNIEVVCGDSTRLIENIEADCIYIDPARRSSSNKRLFALEDCEPNIVELLPRLLNRAQRVIVKVSPMADITQSIRILHNVSEVHVLSVDNECKELLFVCDSSYTGDIQIKTCNIQKGNRQSFDFLWDKAHNADFLQTASPIGFLYEPNSSIMKSGGFIEIGNQYGLQKLHPHSHLYTSVLFHVDFPGRCFHIQEVIPANGKNLKILQSKFGKANLATRNFPMTVQELRKKTKIKDGGDDYLFATTLNNGDCVIIATKKATALKLE